MARGDQLSRQWKIIQTLLTNKMGKSAQDLANSLDCHARTVYRDLEALQMAGFPLYTEQFGHKTLWFIIDDGNRQPPTPLNLDELMALYFSRNMLKVLEGTAIYDSLVSLFEKVKSTLAPEFIRYLEKYEHSLAVGVKAHKPYQRFQDTLAKVQEAAQNQYMIDIEYFTMSRQEITRRRVAPYKVWFYDETFYLIGYCQLRRDVRMFAIDRIKGIDLSQETFDTPRNFDIETFMARSFGVFQGETVKVRILFGPETAGYVQEKIWHPTQALTPQPDGSIIFSAQVAGIEEIKRWVLKWGAGAKVLTPEILRQAVTDEIKSMLESYDSHAPG